MVILSKTSSAGQKGHAKYVKKEDRKIFIEKIAAIFSHEYDFKELYDSKNDEQ